ncbi:hypothetical protein UT300003_07820 [Clostridium sardiniense]
MIELYKFNNKNFDEAGDIVLQPEKCILTMELETGLNEIELTHPLDKEGRWEYIHKDDVISIPTPYLKLPQQLYRIYDRVKNMSSLTIKARHIFYDLIDTVLIDVRPTDLTGQEALNYILKETKYTGYSDIQKESTAYYVRKNIIEAIGGDKENSFISRWGGELFVDNFKIYLNKKVGMDNGVRISYGKNLTSIEETLNFESVITRAIPVGYDGIMLEGDEPWVDSPLINNYANVKMRVVNYDDVKVKENPDDDEGFETIGEARKELKRRVMADFEKGMDKPLVNYSVQFLDLSKVEAYKEYKVLEEVLLGDTVHISHKRLGIELEARVIKIEYNCLTGKMENIELGNYIDSYAKEKADNSITIDNINNSFDDDGNLKGSNIRGAINAIKSPLLAQKDAAVKTDVVAWKTEVTDPNDPNFGCITNGTKGILISNIRTPDGRDWDFRTAISANGIVADWIIGKLKTVLIENVDGSFSIDLNKSGGALFKNNGKEAIEIRNNAANFYNWAKTGELIGSLTSLIRDDNKDEPLIGLVNERNSAVSIGYKDPKVDNIYPSYIEFDKYNILNNYKPIRIYENISLGECSLFFGANDIGEMYSTSDGDIAFKTKHAFGTVDKDTRKWTSFLDSDNVFFAHWKTGEKYFSVNPSRFSMPGFWRGDDGEIWSGVTLNVDKNFHTNGNITCSGKKNRMVKTEHYGERLQNAIESPECWFIDYGEGKLVNGKAIIKIDPIHLETINTDYKYMVRIWSDDGTRVWCRKSNRHKKYFIVEGNADCDFEYEIIAKQKGYENVRLEEVVKEDSTSFSMSKNTKKEV